MYTVDIMVDNKEVTLYGDNPYDLREKRVEGERVVFKDLPLWEPPTLISDYLKSLPYVEDFSPVYLSKARDHITNKPTSCLNGDRYVFMKINPDHPLPEKCVLGDFTCRIWYASRTTQCKRCNKSGHKTDNPACPFYIESPPENYHLFRGGLFSNFHPTSVAMGSTTFASSEHAYQWRACSEHLRDDLAERVVSAKTPSEAKTIAAEIKQKGSPWHAIKYGVMKEVLVAKLVSSRAFRDHYYSLENPSWWRL